MTQWGVLLLCVFIALGVSERLSWRTAGRIAFALTVLVVAGAIISYTRSTPVDKYYRNIDATVYATGDASGPPVAGTAGRSTEDTSGVQPATYMNTVNSPPGGSASAGGRPGY